MEHMKTLQARTLHTFGVRWGSINFLIRDYCIDIPIEERHFHKMGANDVSVCVRYYEANNTVCQHNDICHAGRSKEEYHYAGFSVAAVEAVGLELP